MEEIIMYSLLVVMVSANVVVIGLVPYENMSAKKNLIGGITFKSDYTTKVINNPKYSSYSRHLLYIIKENKDKKNLNNVLNSNQNFRKYISHIYYMGSSEELKKLLDKISNITTRLNSNLDGINKENLTKIFNSNDIYIHLMSKNSEEEVHDEATKIISELSVLLGKVEEITSVYNTLITNDYKLELEGILENFVNEHLNNIEMKLDMDLNVNLSVIFAKENMKTKLKKQKELNKDNKISKLSEEDRVKLLKENLLNNGN